MAYVAKKHRTETDLNSIKRDVEQSYIYSKSNYERYHYFRKFLYKSTLTDDQIALLKELGRPTLEFNIVEAYVSRLAGEFSQQEPSISVKGSNFFGNNDPTTVQLVEGILRSIFEDAKNDYMQYEAIIRLLSGGFNVIKVYTDYAHEMSFDQVIKIRNCFDPTLCGFDPIARESHKADGNYCFELYPKSESDFIAKYGSDALNGIKFKRNINGFNWSFAGEQERIVMVGDYYKKKNKEAKIVQLVTGQVMEVDQYEETIERFNSLGMMMQPPGVVGKSRKTTITTIHHYHVIENQILLHEETDYKYFPLVYQTGSSAIIRDGVNGAAQEVTRPYVYNAEGMQKLINFAGQQLANELENTLQQKWVVAKEAIAENYQDAFTNPQIASTIVYNAFKVDDPSVALPPPREVNRMPAPPEAAATFNSGSKIIQTILGSYDASLGINQNQLSGMAIQNGATQSNAAAMPFNVGYLKGLNQIGNIVVDLIPKYYITPRTVPIIKIDGKRSDILINHPKGTQINYSSNDLQVTITAGVSFAIQQQQALNAILGLAKESPLFMQFLNQEGLEILLDNIDIRGIDHLKQAAGQFMQQMKQKQAQTPDPNMIKMQMAMQQMQQQAQNDQVNAQLKAAQISVQKQDADTNRIKVLAEIGQSVDELELKKDQVQAENSRSAVDFAIQTADLHHKHAKEKIQLSQQLAQGVGKVMSNNNRSSQ